MDTLAIGKEHIPMPIVTLGTWELKGEKASEVVSLAYDVGYRNFDTAFVYENHTSVAKGLRSYPRESYFLSTKIALEQIEENFSKKVVREKVLSALSELATDYIDLLFLHWPRRDLPMELFFEELLQLQKEGKVKEIGVSNFTIHHIEDLEKELSITPAVNQVEFHPRLYQKELLAFCQKKGIVLQAYRPLGKGDLPKDPSICALAKKIGKTPAQVILRWIVQKGLSVIVKSSSKEHLEENLAILEFSLDAKQMAEIDKLNKNMRTCNHPWFDFTY